LAVTENSSQEGGENISYAERPESEPTEAAESKEKLQSKPSSLGKLNGNI